LDDTNSKYKIYIKITNLRCICTKRCDHRNFIFWCTHSEICFFYEFLKIKFASQLFTCEYIFVCILDVTSFKSFLTTKIHFLNLFSCFQLVCNFYHYLKKCNFYYICLHPIVVPFVIQCEYIFVCIMDVTSFKTFLATKYVF
jgi:hypothetical protein